jgi:CheY-like chemotaxis protein
MKAYPLSVRSGEKPVSSSSAEPETAPWRHGSVSILVVEDELLIRLLVSDELRDAGYHVIEAASADEAVAILKSGADVNLILSDVRMPGALDGLGLLAVVRESFPGIPVILTSGHLQADCAIEDGAAHFLPKPYRIELVLTMIDAELGKSR